MATSWTIERSKQGELVATFRGHLSTEAGKASALAFREKLTQQPTVIVFDLTHMKSYDPGAREAWADTLSPARASILRLVVKGGGSVMRMGASLLALVWRVPCELR